MTILFRPHLVRSGDRPPPMVPTGVELADMPKGMLPLNLCKSEWGMTATGDEFRTGIALWAASFHETPAGSLPADDRLLARLADFGRDLAGFLAVREKALEGWVECADGRLYRRSVAIEALAFWIQRLVKRKAAAIGNATRWDKDQAPDVAEFDRQIFHAGDALAQLEPTHPLVLRVKAHRAKAVREGAIGASEPEVDVSDPCESADASAIAIRTPKVSEAKRSQESSLAQSASATRATPCGAAAEDGPAAPAEPHPPPEPYPKDAFDRFWEAYPEKVGSGAARRMFDRVRKRRQVRFEALMAALELYKRTKPPDRAWCHPATWLHQERWADGSPSAGAGVVPIGGGGHVFVAVDSPAWGAWQAEARKAGRRGYPAVVERNGRKGWLFPSEWPTDSRPEPPNGRV